MAGALRITFVIDSLGPGGAQCQLSLLAVHLQRLGHDVEVLTYRRIRWFDATVEAAGIPVRRLVPPGLPRRLAAVRRAVRERDPDVVVAFLSGPAIYAELAGLPDRRFGLIVSEFTVPGSVVPWGQRLRLAAHRLLADTIVTEADAVRRRLLRAAPWLAGRIEVILNGVDLDRFRPDTASTVPAGETRILVLARYQRQKNPFGMLAAMEWLRRTEPTQRFFLDWYGSTFFVDGSPTSLSGVYLALQRIAGERGLATTFRLHDARQDVAALYHTASLVCLPSYYEGCPNVVCEALASGVPVVASDVGGNRALVIDGKTGFLCDPTVPQSIGRAILRFHRMTAREKHEMGQRARSHAETLLSPRRFAGRYARLIARLASRRSPTNSRRSGRTPT